MSVSTRIRNAAFAAATALALSFGAVQVFAAPAAAGTAKAVRACNPATCSYDCTRRGYYGGICMSSNGTLYCSCTG